MSIAERLDQATQPKQRWCKLGQIMLGLEPDDLEVMHNALADRVGYSAVVIAQVLQDEGHDVGDTTVKAHRARTCCCGNR